MGHVRDRWHKPGPSGRKVRSSRYGKGLRWQARWTEHGKQHSQGFPTKEAAQIHLARMATAEPGQRPTLSLTVEEYARTWQESQLHFRPSTAKVVASALSIRIIPELGQMQLDEVTRADVQGAVAVWTGNLAPSTVHVTYAYVSSLFRSAVADGLIESTPCVRIRLPALVRTKIVPLTPEQVETITANVPARYRSMMVVAAGTGMRSGELRGLTVDRITPRGLRVDRQLVGVKHRLPVFGPPKSRAGDRTVPLGKIAREALEMHLEKFGPGVEGLVWWTREGGPVARGDASYIWQQATQGMGLPKGTGWHALRHHHASLLISNGMSATAVGERIGDKPTEVLETYAHLWHDDDERATQIADEAGPSWSLEDLPDDDG